ncbi:MAG: efflux RND transporter periplasmic adaptor subunit [Candidatus Koribacter versatilis]|uniref:Efflux RND transporter periplasmic adaptor subunit n=1 Tax=Candidatus Korobacter versatilis TaxID=658062 RepID=A0A932AA72_9BACT|nr:efflux RND transporter periplasmic adaptor subunit [Candidatus Koribacter versatilis]
MLTKRNLLILGLVLVGIAILAAFKFRGGNDQQYFTSKVEKGDIRQVVDATGTINAVTTVQVGSQVSGTIAKLNVDFNSHVKKGQVIAQIDSSLFQGAVQQASADLESARANLAAARANAEKSKANAAQATADYNRTQALSKEGVMSQQQLDVSRAAAQSATAQVSADQSAVAQAQGQVAQKAAALGVAQTNLSHTTIIAPIDGVVVARSVDVGQTVAASLQAPTLFTIAEDLTKMQVYAKTDESDVGQIRPGQRVSFKVDAFPNQTFYGQVLQVRMNPTTVQNVVTYDTVVNFDNPDMKLFPGMTAYVTIPVAQANDVIKVPNGALRYKPDLPADQVRALYKKYGIDFGSMQRQASAGQGQPVDVQQSAQGGGQAKAGSGGGRRYQRPSAPGGGEPATQEAGGAMPQARERRQDVAIVWKLLPDKSIEPVQIKTGITDHTVTELSQALRGQLNEGDEVITGSSKSGGQSGAARAPGAPGATRGR